MTLAAGTELFAETTGSVTESHLPNLAHRLNWLRAAVLGALST